MQNQDSPRTISKYKPAGFVLFTLLMFLTISGFTQQITFSRENPEEFIEKLSYITTGLNREQRDIAQPIMDSLARLWMSETLTKDQQEIIYSTLEAMQTLRLNPWPEQGLYLKGLLGVLKTRDPQSNFDIWHRSFQSLMTLQTQRRLVRFWEKSIDLFEKNIIFSSNLIRWVLQNNHYTLALEDDVAKIIIRGSDIKGFAQDDSTVIYNASGKVNIIDDVFHGTSGKLTWERVSHDPNAVYANLSAYSITLSSVRWEADSVTFFNRNFFQEPLHGKVVERIIAEMTPETARYPRFESYQSVHEIKNLFRGVDYKGGFTMAGGRIIGSGTSYTDATISIYRNDSLFITARGPSFSILGDRIVTQRTAVSIYLSGDSIYHPNINMRYLDSAREFSVLRDEKGFSRAPFSNTFHNIDMYCEAIYWNIDTYDVDIRMTRGTNEVGNAFFESKDFFSDVRYMRMQGMAQLHPLIRLRNFGRERNSNNFFIVEYAKYIRSDPASVATQLLTFSQDGFLTYNEEDESVTLNDKLFHYITAYTGRTDYDVIRIRSTATLNAQINMNNFDLNMYGVETIPLSDKKNVVLHPTNQQVVMKKNRDIYFNGRIESGLFDFYGKEFFFDYDQFKVELLQTDSMSFRVQSFEPDSRGQHSLVRVRTVLEGINGELLVDHPRNKSGNLPYPRFPIFNSNNESFVYYDRNEVQEGVYNRDDVFFKLIPFSIDSLDNATTDNIAFDGVFISTNIFPDFYDYLRVQTDYSLGFNTHTPKDGYPVYGGKAVYKGPIDMSYEGLRANGQLEYLNSTIQASYMLMFPDSARANVREFNLQAQEAPVEYPEVYAQEVNMLYLPYQDDMSITQGAKPIEIYGGLALLDGSIGITPDGLTGKGNLSLFGGRMASNDFEFKLRDFETEKTNLTLFAAGGQNTAITASNYKAYVNIEDQEARFENIENTSLLDFAINRYEASGFDMQWDMELGVMEMTNALQDEIASLADLPRADWIGYNFTGHEMVSKHPAQDGLRFYAGKIDYTLAENVINASNVKIIRVADAAIYPYDDKLQILERAEIRKLRNAFVIANTTTQLYSFYNAGINITSRWDYSGSGFYDFVNESGEAQTLNFESIAVDRAYRTTIASASVEREQDFTINPYFGFEGKVGLKAESLLFNYSGASRIFIDCPDYNPNWMRFEAELQRDSVFIPLAEDLRNDGNGRIHMAIMLAGDSVNIYPAVLDRQRHYSDLALVSASGYITFDAGMRQYVVTTAEKHLKPSLPDNIITINPNTCIIEGFGDVTLSQSLGQFKMNTFGRVTQNLKENDVNLDIVMGIDFFFLNPALGLVERGINNYEELEKLNLNRQKYVSYLQKKTSEERSQALMASFLEDGAFSRFPPELNHTFFFADLKMKWDQTAQTFHTVTPLGIGNMEAFPMNKYTDGFIEIKRQRGGDIFNMVLIPSGLADEGVGREWFFFTYTNGIMQVIASGNEFNNMIRDVRPNRRRMEVERGEEPFTFILSSDRRPFDFVRSMRILRGGT